VLQAATRALIPSFAAVMPSIEPFGRARFNSPPKSCLVHSTPRGTAIRPLVRVVCRPAARGYFPAAFGSAVHRMAVLPMEAYRPCHSLCVKFLKCERTARGGARKRPIRVRADSVSRNLFSLPKRTLLPYVISEIAQLDYRCFGPLWNFVRELSHRF